MERNGVVYVSSSVTKVDYRRLKLEKHRGVRPDLEEAIKLFQERIRKRYLKQINMLNKDVYNNAISDNQKIKSKIRQPIGNNTQQTETSQADYKSKYGLE